MKKFKQFRKLGFSSLFFLLCMPAFMPANAQRLANADILTTHVDREKGKMYVEMNFYAPSCGEHQVRFSFCNTGAAADTFFNGALVLDSVLTNQHSAGSPRIDTIIDNVAGSKGKDSIRTVLRLDNTAVGGYHLRFDIKDTALFNPGEKPQLCMDVTRLALHCKYCGVERTSLVLDPLTIDDACPYKYKDSILYGKDTMLFYEDLITCRKREGSLAKNWEAFIQDPRDCRTYRIVQMPDSNWWFAQNLNFQSYPSNPKAIYYNKATLYTAMDSSISGTDSLRFWCPGPDSSIASNPREDTTSANKWPCEVYGALYNAKALYLHDGYGGAIDIHEIRLTDTILNARGYISNVGYDATNHQGYGIRPRGICPPEWYIPTDADWGIMLNAVEGCSYPDSSINTDNVACNHLRTHFDAGQKAGSALNPVVNKEGKFNTLGGGPSNYHHNSSYATAIILTFKSHNLGQNAGRYLRATPTCPNGAGNCDDAPNEVPPQGLIHDGNIAQAKSSWTFAGSNNAGTDKYGFSVLPAGFLNKYTTNGSNNGVDKNQGVADNTKNRFFGRGYAAVFLTSTVRKTSAGAARIYSPLARLISYNRNDVQQFYYHLDKEVSQSSYQQVTPSMTNAYSVRCVKTKN